MRNNTYSYTRPLLSRTSSFKAYLICRRRYIQTSAMCVFTHLLSTLVTSTQDMSVLMFLLYIHIGDIIRPFFLLIDSQQYTYTYLIFGLLQEFHFCCADVSTVVRLVGICSLQYQPFHDWFLYPPTTSTPALLSQSTRPLPIWWCCDTLRTACFVALYKNGWNEIEFEPAGPHSSGHIPTPRSKTQHEHGKNDGHAFLLWCRVWVMRSLKKTGIYISLKNCHHAFNSSIYGYNTHHVRYRHVRAAHYEWAYF